MSQNYLIPLRSLPPRSPTTLPSTTPPTITSTITTPLSYAMPTPLSTTSSTTILTRPRNSSQVFSTSSPVIAFHLQHRYRWEVKTVALSEIPGILETSCIIEKDDGTISFDKKMLECEKMVEKLREALRRDGVQGEMEVKYEGRMKRMV